MLRFPNETDEEFDARRYVSTVLFKKDGIEEVQSETKMGLGFAKDMPEWLADQPELAQKVANKENGYRFINMHAVVEEYNANCEQ